VGPLYRPLEGENDINLTKATGEVRLLIKLARALQHYGAPAHRLEEACMAVCRALGLEGHFFSTPTAVFASFGELEQQRTCLLRVNSGDAHLERLSQLDWMIGELIAGRMDTGRGVQLLDDLEGSPERYGVIVSLLAFVVVSASAARFLGGGVTEILVAGCIGLLIGIWVWVSMHRPQMGNVLMPISAITAAAVATLAAHWLTPFTPFTATVAGLIVLVPGLSFTTAMVELATGHLASGTARLAKATSMFMLMAFGIALGNQLSKFFPPAGEVATLALEPWTQWLALLLAPPTFAILFRARPADVGWVSLAGMAAFLSARVGGELIGPELGGFVASFILGIGSNAFARIMRRPAAIMMEPGIILLVPGTIGLRSLTALLANDPMRGVDTAFSMVLIAIALVIGLLFANVVLPPRRSL